MLPPEWTTDIIQSVEHAGQAFTLGFRVNLFGEVIRVDNHFAQLPPAARVLMLGDIDFRPIERELERAIAYHRLAFPMAALGYLSGPEWALFQQWLQNTWQTFGPHSIPDHATYLTDPLTHGIYLLEDESGTKVLDLIREILTAGTAWEEKIEKTFVVPDPAWELVWINFLPVMQKDYLKERMFKQFGLFRTERAWRFLLAALKRPDYQQMQNSILEGLQAFRHPEILQELKTFLEQQMVGNDKMGFFTSYQLMEHFAAYGTSDLQPLLYRALSTDTVNAAGKILETLSITGATETAIFDCLSQQLNETKAPGKIRACLSGISELEDPALYLPMATTIPFLRWAYDQPEDDMLPVYLGRILKRIPEEEVIPKMKILWEDDHSRARELLLEVIYESGRTDLLFLVLSVLDSGPDDLQMKAMSIVESLGKKMELPEVVPKLIELSASENEEVQAKALSTLCAVLKLTHDAVALKWLADRARQMEDTYLQEEIAEVQDAWGLPEGEAILEELCANDNSGWHYGAQKSLQKIRVRKISQRIRQTLDSKTDDEVLAAFLAFSQSADELERKGCWATLDYLLERLGPVSYDFRRLAEWKCYGWASEMEMRRPLLGRPGGFVLIASMGQMGGMELYDYIQFPQRTRDFPDWIRYETLIEMGYASW
ncbi:hypothetical protein CRP01_31030 [Flavilitoribacter nigricans DSM 23189 = NBRC 102662]|uniref:HEAT repeat domain-containing protein n=2 Tax=Flavilitoribacter TaxID=2762562 RepID=A0A2D0N3A7_FLAN2|nr:hypothetical protein CRP01_31030 [Flavilitoribacter nigricans DSM 23189 = NBRC 102662]